MKQVSAEKQAPAVVQEAYSTTIARQCSLEEIKRVCANGSTKEKLEALAKSKNVPGLDAGREEMEKYRFLRSL